MQESKSKLLELGLVDLIIGLTTHTILYIATSLCGYELSYVKKVFHHYLLVIYNLQSHLIP